ncbi:hypothetical protein JQ629_35180 [Bradyrhizobium sp. AUGA SZCCT0222]|uniref:hypothetical protein n=1 Tax=Bradyrhizobium sp. AUGA SZCCT0222 TaxID=2807668 RepID=UPI001BA5E3F1|nr:hypothetical protein [Bradyrhizobium sp. AUGA SZCCT0222]MBR1272735.1 hypothetical protein [Bradyrhizobium sp. AUGA SZCCT0222]
MKLRQHGAVTTGMGKKAPPPEDDPEDNSRTEQARQVAEEYATSEFIEKLRKLFN